MISFFASTNLPIATTAFAQQLSETSIPTDTIVGAAAVAIVYIALKVGLPKMLEMKQEHEQKKTESAMGMLSTVLDALIGITSESQRNVTDANKAIESLTAQTTALVTIMQSLESRVSQFESRHGAGNSAAFNRQVEQAKPIPEYVGPKPTSSDKPELNMKD